jgi:Fe-S-cluster containining protein
MEFDCRSCGACCCASTFEYESHAPVNEDDVSRLTPKQRLEIVDGHIRTKCSRKNNGLYICVFLRGLVGHQVRCVIYKKRPRECVLFEPGSLGCVETRRQHYVQL